MTGSTPRQRAEALLSADPRIESFTIQEAGEALRITAVGAADWFAERRQAAQQAISGRMLRQWRFVYDRSYRTPSAAAPNFDVWISNFTNAPIPVERMRVWLNHALRQMRSVKHDRVLDIGCGAGLVLAELAPGGTSYDGIDLSEEAVTSLGAWAATQDGLGHVRLAQGAAHELGGRGGEPVDLAVLNSVAQYFPDAAYLDDVIFAAAGQVATGGAIFLGDLRASALLPLHALNVAATRAPPGATVGEVQAKARLMLERTGEFAVDPGFFQNVGARLQRPAQVCFALKPREADRELAGYRYDALLRLDEAERPAAPAVTASSLDAVLAHLDDAPEALAVLGLPNARLAQDAALARAVKGVPAEAPLAHILQTLAPGDAIEPEHLADAVAERGYEAELRLTPGNPEGRFDALLLRRSGCAGWPAGEPTGLLTNDPLAAELAADLRRELQSSVEAAIGARVVAFDLRPASRPPSL